MESVYVFPAGGEEAVRDFRRKLYNAWLLDLDGSGARYDVLIRRARAERRLDLVPAEDLSSPHFAVEKGSVFFLFSSEGPLDGLLRRAAEESGNGLGPFLCPLSEDFSVTEVVSFKR